MVNRGQIQFDDALSDRRRFPIQSQRLSPRRESASGIVLTPSRTATMNLFEDIKPPFLTYLQYNLVPSLQPTSHMEY